MPVKSQETNMRRLAGLLSQDLGYIWGEREAGPSGAKKTFLNLGKVFLRALARDLGLREAKITSDSGGIAVSGGCDLIGMWENGGIYISLSQFCGGKYVLLYRTARNIRDYTGGYNNFLSLDDLRKLSYSELLGKLRNLRKEDSAHERSSRNDWAA